jgi:hypothetical protein
MTFTQGLTRSGNLLLRTAGWSAFGGAALPPLGLSSGSPEGLIGGLTVSKYLFIGSFGLGGAGLTLKTIGKALPKVKQLAHLFKK